MYPCFSARSEFTFVNRRLPDTDSYHLEDCEWSFNLRGEQKLRCLFSSFFTQSFVAFKSIWSVELIFAFNLFLMTTTSFFFSVCVHPDLIIECRGFLLDLQHLTLEVGVLPDQIDTPSLPDTAFGILAVNLYLVSNEHPFYAWWRFSLDEPRSSVAPYRRLLLMIVINLWQS